MTVGLLGATGTVGKGAMKILMQLRGHNLLIGSRNIKASSVAFPDQINSLVYVDIENDIQLNDFCKKSDIIINCAGPYSKILDKVANACIDSKTHYVDASGGKYLARTLDRRLDDIINRELVCVMTAGIYPGLTELFPAYLVSNTNKKLSCIEVFFGSRSTLSYNAAYDYVSGLEEDNGQGLAYINNNKTVRIDGSFRKKYLMPEPIGLIDSYPVISKEFEIMINKYLIEKAYFYNTYPDKRLMSTLIKIKAMQQYKTEKEKEDSANKLIDIFKTQDLSLLDVSIIDVLYTVNTSSSKEKYRARLTHYGSSNELTGMVAASVACGIINGKNLKVGSFTALEVINPNDVMTMLGHHITISTNRICESEGEI